MFSEGMVQQLNAQTASGDQARQVALRFICVQSTPALPLQFLIWHINCELQLTHCVKGSWTFCFCLTPLLPVSKSSSNCGNHSSQPVVIIIVSLYPLTLACIYWNIRDFFLSTLVLFHYLQLYPLATNNDISFFLYGRVMFNDPSIHWQTQVVSKSFKVSLELQPAELLGACLIY